MTCRQRHPRKDPGRTVGYKVLGKMAPLVIGLLRTSRGKKTIGERTLESVEHRRRTGGNRRTSWTASNKEDHIVRLRNEGNSLRQIVSLTGSPSSSPEDCKEHENAVAA